MSASARQSLRESRRERHPGIRLDQCRNVSRLSYLGSASSSRKCRGQQNRPGRLIVEHPSRRHCHVGDFYLSIAPCSVEGFLGQCHVSVTATLRKRPVERRPVHAGRTATLCCLTAAPTPPQGRMRRGLERSLVTAPGKRR